MANTTICGVEADGGDLMCGVASADGDLLCGVAVSYSLPISVQWESSTNWTDVPKDGYRELETSNMESGDVITVYYQVRYWGEDPNGTGSGGSGARENSTGSFTIDTNSWSNSSYEYANENHPLIDHDDSVEVRLYCDVGHPEDYVYMEAEITSVTTTSGGKDSEVGSRDVWDDVISGLIE